jgi:glycine/D-amino acid oxidase-like deaminating enzyme
LANGLPRLAVQRHLPIDRPDVAVVGTGITGALMADALLSAGLSVVALDRRPAMTGSSPASTALLQSELDVPFITLRRKLGKSAATRVWHRSAQAVQALSDRIGDLCLDCDHMPRCSLYLPGNRLDASGLQDEAAARREVGLRSSFLTRQELWRFAGLARPGAIRTAGNAEANPVKLTVGLWRSFIQKGGRVVTGADVADLDHSRSAVRIELADGRRLIARTAVFCTGYELMKFARPRGYKITSTWVIATKPQRRRLWPSGSLLWEAADPYLYIRSTPDSRIIAGGEDEPFSDDQRREAMLPQKAQRIATKAGKLLPAFDFTADFSWSGSFGESATGLPAFGSIRGMPRCYAVLGFGGNGITFSMLAAQIVSRQILGTSDPDAELFAL